MSLGPFTQSRAKPQPKPDRAGFQSGRGYAAPQPGGAARPPAPTPSPMAPATPPWEPMLNHAVSGIHSSKDINLAGLNEAEKYLRLDFGLVTNPDGSFAIDVGNPASKAALMQRTYQQARRGDLNSMAGRGQLTSGAYLRQVGERNRGEQMDFNALTRAFSQGLGDISRQRQATIANAGAEEAGLRLQFANQFAGDSSNTPIPAGPPPAPKEGFKFVQTKGTRAGLSYNLVRGRDGKLWRLYENGDKIPRGK